MSEDDLRQRFRAFALRILKLCEALPHTPGGRTIAGQLARSGTSPGSNYRAACRARSRADFINKLGIVEEEIDESAYWLDLIIAGRMLHPPLVEPLLREAEELTRIMTSSRLTAIQNAKRKETLSVGRRLR